MSEAERRAWTEESTAYAARKREVELAEAASLLTCPLIDPRAQAARADRSWNRLKRAPCCLWCGGPLAGRRMIWCSDPCWQNHYGNHRWNSASARRLLADGGRCVRCGDRAGASRTCEGPEARAAMEAYEVALRAYERAARLAGPFGEVPAYPEYPRRRRQGWRECWDPDCKSFHALAQGRLQIDHRVPREGRGYGDGCHHHQDNLQTLCVPCHAVKGVVWRAVQEALRRAAAVAIGPGEVPEELRLW